MPFNKFVVLSIAIVAVTSIQPSCEPDNQFRLYCFSIEFCDDYGCYKNNCGRFVTHAKLIKIKDSKIIPKCAFSNADQLKIIHGANRNIEVIASGAFVNLPQLDSIILPFNLIRELHHATFKNVTLSSLDLSWNKIVYIQEGAFDGINGLQHLNLSRNELFTIPVQGLSSSLIDLNLSNNFLRIIAVNYARFPNLTNIDFSNNKLKNVALFFEKPVEKIDLNQNQLEDIDLFEVRHCEKLKIALNKFSKAPTFLKYASLRSVVLHPNPWKCSELKEVWADLQNNFVNVDGLQTQQDGPICSESVPLNVLSKIVDQKRCDDDSSCDVTELCRGAKCHNPCNENVCDPGSNCVVNEHKFECLCPGNQKRDPTNIYSACVDVECFTRSECSVGRYCINNKCQSPQIGRPSYGLAPDSNGGVSGFSQGIGHHLTTFEGPPVVPESGYGGAPGAGYGGVSNGGFGGTAGAGYGGAPGASYGGTSSGGFVGAPSAGLGGAFGSGYGGSPETGYVGAPEAEIGGVPPQDESAAAGQSGTSVGGGFLIEANSNDKKEPWWVYEIPVNKSLRSQTV